MVIDLNKDGRNDLVWGDGHNYGLYWHEQLEPRKDGTTVWKHHLIDKKISQMHALAWEDLDNDESPRLSVVNATMLIAGVTGGQRMTL